MTLYLVFALDIVTSYILLFYDIKLPQKRTQYLEINRLFERDIVQSTFKYPIICVLPRSSYSNP